MTTKLLAAALFAATALAGAANAAPLTLNLAWSGAEYGNTATGVGQITLDDSSFNRGVVNGNAAAYGITALSVTFTTSGGASTSYGLGDFATFNIGNPGTSLNLSQQLIGQALGNGCNFGQRGGSCGAGASGDFNLFSQTGAPNGSFYFQIPFNGEQLGVTSMTAAADVPEPAMLGLFGLGAIGLGLSRRRRA